MTPDHHAEIQRRAYLLWERDGRPEGRSLDHWLRAEAEIGAQRQSPAAASAAPIPPAARAKRPAKREVKARR